MKKDVYVLHVYVSLQLRILYGSANDPTTANDPGPQMIPDGDRKRSRLKNKEWHGCGNGEGRELG